MKILTVISVETKTDKNKNPYSRIKLSQPSFVMQSGMKVRVEPKVQNIVKYPKSYLPDGAPQFGHDFKEGEPVAGDIVTVGNLLPYPIIDDKGITLRHATSATHLVLGNTDNEDEFNAAILREFSNRGLFLAADPEAEVRYAKFWKVEAPDYATTAEAKADVGNQATVVV